MFATFIRKRNLFIEPTTMSETVKARLATYEEQTRPLIDYYQANGLLQTVDGIEEPETIYEDVEADHCR